MMPSLGKQRTGSLIITEGEKDATALLALGLSAVSSPHGAKGRWLPAYTDAIIDAGFSKAYVIGDHDAAGADYNRTVPQTEAVYRRYAITSEADLREGVERLNGTQSQARAQAKNSA